MENSLLEAIKSGNMGCHSELTIIPISQTSKSNSQYTVSSTSPQSTVSLSLVPNTSNSSKSKNKHSLSSSSQGGAPRKRGKSSMPPLNHMAYDMNNYNPLLDLTMNRKHYPNYNAQPEQQQWPFNLPFNYPELLMNFSQVNKRKSYPYEQTKEKTAVNYNKENTQNKTKHYKHEHMPPPPPTTTNTDRISGQLENVEKTFDIDSLSSEDGWAKYRELLVVIEEMSGSIRPIYTGCKNSTERLKKSIHKAKALVSECLKEVEKVSRQL